MKCETCGQDVAVDDGVLWYHTENMSAFCDPEGEERIDRQASPEYDGRFTFNLSGTHRCDRCSTMFPYTPCHACDLSHDCADGYFDASLYWEHVFDDEDEED